MFPGHETPPGWKSKDNPGLCREGPHWLWQAVGQEEMEKGLLPQSLPGLTQFLSGRALSRKVPLELVLVKCIILKCISCGAAGAGKAGADTPPGSSPAGELPLLPPLLRVLVTAGSGSRDIGVSLQHVHGKQGPRLCRHLCSCPSQTIRAQLEMAFCV